MLIIHTLVPVTSTVLLKGTEFLFMVSQGCVEVDISRVRADCI